MTSNKTAVGKVGVDTGRLLIIDPCYLKELPNYEDLGPNGTEPSKQLNFSAGHPGLAVIVNTGYGDGTYTVEAEIFEDFSQFDQLGKSIARIRKITIQFTE